MTHSIATISLKEMMSMPRVAREKSATGIYHIIMRGINRQTVFVESEDSVRFVETLERYNSICEYELYAYCLMGNHVHLLLKEGGHAQDMWELRFVVQQEIQQNRESVSG